MSSQIAVQGYTLRDFASTPADVAKTCARIKKIGYDAVQVSAWAKMDPHELAKILKNEGLICCATHTSIEEILQDPQRIAEEHRILGCKHSALGGMTGLWDHSIPKTKERFIAFAKEISTAAKKLKPLGISYGYHNHKIEFQKIDGEAILDLLIRETSPEVTFELDTFWVQTGGGDPAAWIDKVKGRIPLLHLKDLTIVDDQVIMAEVGEGNINFHRIINSARAAGVEWYIIEQDICQRDPFESIAISLKNIKAMGVK